MEKKKILLVYYKLFRAGGVAKVMTNLANELTEQGYDVEILLMTKNQDTFYSLNKNVKIHSVDMFQHWAWKICEFNVKYLKFIPKIQNINSYISHIGVFLLLKNWLSRNHQNYDKIISCWYKLSSFIGLIGGEIAKKTIAWEHTDYNVGGSLYSKILRKNYTKIYSIVCINTPSITHYQQFNKTSFIPNIIGEPFESNDFIPTENKENLISFVGRLDKDKNVMDLLEIFAQANIPNDWKLEIIGDGREKQKLETFVTKNNLQDRILFLGNKTSDEILTLLNKSKIFAFTSLKEGLPTVLIEALFCSNTLIAYNCNYGPSDIINEKNGFLIPLCNKQLFKEKIEYLTNNEVVITELIKISYQEAQNWKKDKIIQKWKKIL